MMNEKKSAISEAVSAASEQLIAALKEGKSEELTRYLSAMSTFHSYSFLNILLIVSQRPTATRVAGFNGWKKLGRHVRKGEKGIRIMAPMVVHKKGKIETDGEVMGNATSQESSFIHYRNVYVFAEDQTEGDPLPELKINRVEGDVSNHFDRLVQHVEGRGITLGYRDDMEADGLSYGGRIELKSGMPAAETFAVLVHELAHEELHRGARRKETTKVVRETEAEAVAFVVSSALGLETNRAAVDYIQLWSGDDDVLMASLSFIQKTAAGILKAISNKVEESTETQQSAELPLAA